MPLILQIVNKFRAYALAFIFITGGIYLWILLSSVYIAFDKGMDKGAGSCCHDYYNRHIYGNNPGDCYITLLSRCCAIWKKIDRNNPFMAGHL